MTGKPVASIFVFPLGPHLPGSMWILSIWFDEVNSKFGLGDVVSDINSDEGSGLDGVLEGNFESSIFVIVRNFLSVPFDVMDFEVDRVKSHGAGVIANGSQFGLAVSLKRVAE